MAWCFTLQTVSKILLLLFSGIATGYTFNCIYIEDINGQEKVINGIFEVAGNEKSGSQIIENYPKGTYCHYNT